MISCETAMELLSVRLDGPLSQADAEKLNAHLAQCPACRAMEKDLAQMHMVLPELREKLPEGLHEAILDRIRAEQVTPISSSRRFGHVRRRWVALAAAVALVLGGIWGTLHFYDVAGGGTDSSDSSLMGSIPETDGGEEANTMLGHDDSTADTGGGNPSPAPDITAPAGTPETRSSASAEQPARAAGGDTGEQETAPSSSLSKYSGVEPSASMNSALSEETGTTADVQEGTATPASPEDTSPSETDALDREMMFLAPKEVNGTSQSPSAMTEADAKETLQALLDKTDTAGELIAQGLSPNGQYYEFSLSGADGKEENRYAVSLDGGDIVSLFVAGDDGTPVDNGAEYRQAVGET